MGVVVVLVFGWGFFSDFIVEWKAKAKTLNCVNSLFAYILIGYNDRSLQKVECRQRTVC